MHTTQLITKKNMALMKTNKTLLIFILPILTTSILMSSSEAYSVNHPSHHTKSVRGVYWFQGSIDVSAIDSSLFTHIFCAFANLDSDTFNVTIGASDTSVFSTFTSTLQRRNPHISTLLSVGGGGSNATAFAAMTASPAARKAFIDSSIYVARSNNFHGLDLDYEFPVTTADMNNLAVLLSEWRSAVNAESKSSRKPCLLLTSAVYYTAVYHSVPLPAKAMGRYLDWINLMAYDFFAPAWSTLTRPAAALNDPTSAITGANGANAWLNAGVPAKKVVLGVPYYGRAYELSNAADHTYLAAFKGALPGTDNGAMTYRQIKAFIANNTAAITTVYNATTAESYSYVGTTWITYDGVEAISDKMKFVKEKGLLGYFAWQVGGDDEKFTLSRTAGRVLR